MLSWSVLIAQVLLVARHGLRHLPHAAGPRAQDRVLALDTLYVNADAASGLRHPHRQHSSTSRRRS